jgi:hypothetical protein
VSKLKKQKGFQFGDRVEVTWRDTTGHGGWMSLHEGPLEPVTVTQLGYFMRQDKHTLHICQGVPDASEGCQVVAPTAIPAGCVVSVKRMKESG